MIKEQVEAILQEYLLNCLDMYKDKLEDFIEALNNPYNIKKFYDYLDDIAKIKNIHSYLNRDIDEEISEADEDIAYRRVLELQELQKNSFR